MHSKYYSTVKYHSDSTIFIVELCFMCFIKCVSFKNSTRRRSGNPWPITHIVVFHFYCGRYLWLKRRYNITMCACWKFCHSLPRFTPTLLHSGKFGCCVRCLPTKTMQQLRQNPRARIDHECKYLRMCVCTMHGRRSRCYAKS